MSLFYAWWLLHFVELASNSTLVTWSNNRLCWLVIWFLCIMVMVEVSNYMVSFILTFALWILYFFLSQVNHVTLSTIATYTPVKRNIQTATGTGRNQGYCLRTKVKSSIEADVLAKDATTSESVDDNSGTSCILLLF